MEVGRPQVVVGVALARLMTVAIVMIMMAMVVVVVMAAAQQEYAGDVHEQTEHGNNDRFVVSDGRGLEEPFYRLYRNARCKDRQQQRARKDRQFPNFSCAKCETPAVRVPAREAVGKRRNSQCARMVAI